MNYSSDNLFNKWLEMNSSSTKAIIESQEKMLVDNNRTKRKYIKNIESGVAVLLLSVIVGGLNIALSTMPTIPFNVLVFTICLDSWMLGSLIGYTIMNYRVLRGG